MASKIYFFQSQEENRELQLLSDPDNQFHDLGLGKKVRSQGAQVQLKSF
jgi:hypothetical protein